MTPHSVNDNSFYLGTILTNGRLCHRWSDGTVLPILSGSDGEDDGSGDDDGGDDDDGADDDDGDDDDDEGGDGDEDDDDDDSKRKPSAKSVNKAHRDAAKYRTRLRDERTAHTATKEKLTAAEAKVAKYEKDGVTDEATKTKIAEMETELSELRKFKEQREEADAEQSRFRQVEEELDELKLTGLDPDYVITKLRKSGMLTIDDDGEIEDLNANLKKLLKSGVIKKVTSGDDDNDGNDTGRAGASRSGRSVNSGQRRKKDGYDKAKLAKKYPALRDRVS
jgi:hypothetical protein